MSPVRRPRDSDRLHTLVLRYFERMGRAEFPTVRRAARTLHWKYERVLQAVTEDPDRMFTTSHNTSPEPPLGDHYIEVY
jgi:hypothetical protein